MSTGSNVPQSISIGAKTILVSGTLVFCGMIALVFFAFDPTKVSFFPPCLFHEVTGLDCPGCGAQRALHELLHGDIVTAVRLNAMFILSLPLLAWFGPLWSWRAWHHQPLQVSAKWLTWYGIAWLVFGILRNLPIAPFTWLFAV